MSKLKIPQKVVDELNRQFNQELSAAHSYLALSVWCDVRNLKGFGKYFVKQAGEERLHADRILKHMTDRGLTAEVAAVPAPKQDFKTLLEVAQQAQAQEHANTLGVNPRAAGGSPIASPSSRCAVASRVTESIISRTF